MSFLPNHPQRELTRGLELVPNSLTTVPGANGDTWLFQIVVTNVTGSSATFTLQDGQGTPVKLFNAVSVDPNVPLVFSVDKPVLFKGGFKWTAGTASALYADVIASTLGTP